MKKGLQLYDLYGAKRLSVIIIIWLLFDFANVFDAPEIAKLKGKKAHSVVKKILRTRISGRILCVLGKNVDNIKSYTE